MTEVSAIRLREVILSEGPVLISWWWTATWMRGLRLGSDSVQSVPRCD